MTEKGFLSAKTAWRAVAFAVALLLMIPGMLSCRRGGGEGTSDAALTTGAPAAFELKFSDYKIIYPEKATAACRGASRELKNALEALCGGSIAMQDDWSRDGQTGGEDAKEILIGATNRPQSADAPGVGWSVRTDGSRVVVTASDDQLLYYAVNALTTAVIPAGEGTAHLPLELSLAADSFVSIGIAADGVPAYPIVYSRYVNSELAAAITKLKTKIDSILGSEKQTIRNDALSKAGSYNSATTEILVGDTDYTESGEGMARFGGAEYGFTVVGNKLIVGGRTPVTTAMAVERLAEMLDIAAVTDENGKKSIILQCPDVARFTNYGYRTDVPDVPGLELSRAVDTGEGGLMLCYDGAPETAFADYCTSAEKAGFTRIAESKIGSNSYSTYEKEGSDTRLYVAYAAGSLRIVTEPQSVGHYLGDSAAGGGEVTFTQMALDYPKDNTNGMGYVLKLGDGSFAVWDGGFTADAARLCEYLKNNTPAGEKPRVRLWILTHMHGDHIQCFLEFADKYSGEIKLENLMAAVPETYCDPEGKTAAWSKVKKAALSFAGAVIVKPQEGDVIRLPGADIEVLGTYSLVMRHGLHSDAQNDTSIVTRIVCGDTGILLPGDAQIPMGDALVAEYGAALRSKYVQIAHHGSINWPTSRAFYEAVEPEYAFFPGSASRFAENRKTDINKYVIGLVGGADHVYVADGKNIEIKINN